MLLYQRPTFMVLWYWFLLGCPEALPTLAFSHPSECLACGFVGVKKAQAAGRVLVILLPFAVLQHFAFVANLYSGAFAVRPAAVWLS